MRYKTIHKGQKGFTLVELLVVIAIIGILSTLLMTNFIGVRQRARDAQRKADLRQIQSALELYRADQGAYPPPATNGSTYTLISTLCPTPGQFPTNGTTVYMQTVPCEPLATSNVQLSNLFNSGNYYYNSDGSSYTVAACLENTSDSEKSSAPSSLPTSGSCTGVYVTYHNP